MKILRGDKNQCQGCNQYFNSIKAFDKHRTGKHGVDRRCMTSLEMTEAGMSVNSSSFWITQKKTNEVIERLHHED
jgi:hypothetical protein